jgi:Uma2 family endonuclease
MGELARPKMTVDEFLAWAEGREGRFELEDGEIVFMSPQKVGMRSSKCVLSMRLPPRFHEPV